MPIIRIAGPLGSGVQQGMAQGPQLAALGQRDKELEFQREALAQAEQERREALAQAMEQEQIDAEALGSIGQLTGGGNVPKVVGGNVGAQAGAQAVGALFGAAPKSIYGLDRNTTILPQADIVRQRAIDSGASPEVISAINEDIDAMRTEIVEQADTAKTVQLLQEWGQIYPEQQQFVDIATGMAGQVPAKELLREALKGISDSNAQQSEMMSRQAFLMNSRAQREALNDPNHPFRQELLASGFNPFEIDEIVKGIQKKKLLREFERGFDMQQGQPEPGSAPPPQEPPPEVKQKLEPTGPLGKRRAATEKARIEKESKSKAKAYEKRKTDWTKDYGDEKRSNFLLLLTEEIDNGGGTKEVYQAVLNNAAKLGFGQFVGGVPVVDEALQDDLRTVMSMSPEERLQFLMGTAESVSEMRRRRRKAEKELQTLLHASEKAFGGKALTRHGAGLL